MMKKMMGFTLAEVLTTLMVIGVVAAMTIPTLMNATNDQQLRVAYRKAMSVLGQGVQLMVAKEVECTVNNDNTLAQCFADNVLSGSVVQGYAAEGANGGSRSDTATDNNTVVTSDGLAYSFYYRGPNSNVDRGFDEICGSLGGDNGIGNAEEDYNGANATCYVIVDVNGLNKGTKRFAVQGAGNNGTKAALTSNSVAGTDQQPILITGNGVRPMYVDGVDDLNKGYSWMFGSDSKPWSNAQPPEGEGEGEGEGNG